MKVLGVTRFSYVYYSLSSAGELSQNTDFFVV